MFLILSDKELPGPYPRPRLRLRPQGWGKGSGHGFKVNRVEQGNIILLQLIQESKTPEMSQLGLLLPLISKGILGIQIVQDRGHV